MVSRQPRKQRLAMYTASATHLGKGLRAHLAENLIVRYKTRAVTVRVGDTVKVLRGDYRGHSGKIIEVFPDRGRIAVEGVTVKKSDQTEVPKPVYPSNVVVTRLDLSDRRRREKLGATAEEAGPETAPAPATAPEPAPAPRTAPPPEAPPKAPPPKADGPPKEGSE